MIDLAWMLSSLAGGGFITLFAAAYVNIPAALVAAYIGGWAMCQRDHNYRRVQDGRR